MHKAAILNGCWLLLSFFLLTGCEVNQPCEEKDLKECKVAVVLPYEDNLQIHWEQCLNLCATNMTRAFCNAGKGVKLTYEWYDECSPYLDKIMSGLAKRNDITAVIGGLYSGDAVKMASYLSKGDKPFFTVATTEQLVRAYASWGNLWAMTETDITQCEVLLSKAIQYGAKSVALIAQEESAYGQTFIDWFAFQAAELGVECKGVFTYTDDVTQTAENAFASGADYIICAPSDANEVKVILERHNASPCHARLLFSDIAHGTHVINSIGRICEGVEGVTINSDPETGFDVAYEVRFGMQPTACEAQVYDAAMLIAYAALLQQLHPRDLTFQAAMRQLVDGRESIDAGWRWEDAAWVAKELIAGHHPDVNGASGNLEFDSKVYTNVLHTIYSNYLIYQQRYVFLDYNSTDGSRRSDPTLAGWNWKASQMQQLSDSSTTRTYPPKDKKWALLVATSTGWDNYRHQVDVLNIYQILRNHGYDDDHIVLIMEDDLAYSKSNPKPGVLYTRMDGVNVYHDVKRDYKLTQVSADDIMDILTGKRSDHLPEVLEPDSTDNVFLFWSGHGVPGGLCWNKQYYGLTASKLEACLSEMERNHQFRKFIGCIETCYSGSVFHVADRHQGTLFFTAANANETSKADVYNYNWDVWMSNRFTATLQDCMNNEPTMTFRDLYYRLFQSTVGSHVCVFGQAGYGSLYTTGLEEILE